MSNPHAPPPPPPPPLPRHREKQLAVAFEPSSSSSPPQLPALMMPPLLPLYKQRSWSPDIFRDEAWLKRKGNSKNRRSKSVTDEDLDELKACIELGFGFDSPEVDQRLSDTLPALGLYYAVNKNYNDTVSKTSSPSAQSDCDSIPSPVGSPHAIFGPDDEEQAETMGASGCLYREAKHVKIRK
ncbi:hypothetical protein CCACVL1_26363 [Corchorus capsularis]|uniref:Uncharacterized protein n=1 Tax=Corchorus capsularis TaxID=210143 RepID=A0A1R3GF66_COCAP|nr:hypothetical protein CCACVL1_26363 [Corchorus capsularis]